MMQAARFLICWGLAFATLCAALVLLNIFYNVIESDLELKSLGKEAALAGFASLFQGVTLWVIFWVVHGAGRLILVAGIIVAVLYRLGHLTEWSSYHVAGLLIFQLGLWSVLAALWSGHFAVALVIVAAFGGGLTIIASIARTL
jgi:hypothetical protein